MRDFYTLLRATTEHSPYKTKSLGREPETIEAMIKDMGNKACRVIISPDTYRRFKKYYEHNADNDMKWDFYLDDDVVEKVEYAKFTPTYAKAGHINYIKNGYTESVEIYIEEYMQDEEAFIVGCPHDLGVISYRYNNPLVLSKPCIEKLQYGFLVNQELIMMIRANSVNHVWFV